MRWCMIVLVCVLSTGAAESESRKINHAVMPLRNADGVTAGEASLITDRLRIELFNTGKVNIMEREQMQDVLAEQGFQQSGACTDDACIVEMGQLLGVERMISGSVGRLGKTLVMLNMRVIEVQSGKLIAVVARDVKGEIEDVVNHLAGLSRELLGDKPVTAASRPPEGQREAPAANEPVVQQPPLGQPPLEQPPVQQPPSVSRTPALPFITSIGMGVAGGIILLPEGFSHRPDQNNQAGLFGIHLCIRFVKFIEFDIGAVVPVFELIPETGTGRVTYRSVQQPSQIFYDGQMTVTMENIGVGFTEGLGAVIPVGKRLSLYAGCALTMMRCNLEGKLNLPDIGASVPENIYGHNDHTLVHFNPKLRIEFYIVPKVSLVASGGASLSNETIEYSPGYREWANKYIVEAPEEHTSFSLAGPEFSLGLRWYWRR
jgi:hypothetical protein